MDINTPLDEGSLLKPVFQGAFIPEGHTSQIYDAFQKNIYASPF